MKSKLIKGNNVEVLDWLVDDLAGSVDLVYIDPPYNTKQTFSVSSNRVSTISRSKKNATVAYCDNYDNGNYLTYINKVIKRLYCLLSDQGTLYLHIDCSVNHYLRLILDDVFGADNFLNEIARIKCNPKNSKRRAWGNNHDVVLVYAKNKNKNIWNYVREVKDSDKKRFNKKDESGLYTTVPIHAPGETINGVTGENWRGLKPPEGRHWRVSPSELDRLNENGLIEWSKTGNPRLKRYLKDYKGSLVQDTWLYFKDPQSPSYPTQKNNEMLDMIVRQSSNEQSVVLDCFCGSGSTLLAASNNNRSFIGVDCSEVAIETCKQNLEDRDYTFIDFSSGAESTAVAI